MSSIQIWGKVPDGSKLELSVETTTGKCVSGARLRENDGTEEQWVDSQLNPGPKRKTLRSPRNYVVTVRVMFTGADQSAATISASITKPDGTTHSDPFNYEISGSKGDVERATILVQTLKS